MIPLHHKEKVCDIFKRRFNTDDKTYQKDRAHYYYTEKHRGPDMVFAV